MPICMLGHTKSYTLVMRAVHELLIFRGAFQRGGGSVGFDALLHARAMHRFTASRTKGSRAEGGKG